MRSNGNYPPGMNESMLPGCSDQDEWAEDIMNSLDLEIANELDTNPVFMSYFESFDTDYSVEYVAEKLTDRYYEIMEDEE